MAFTPIALELTDERKDAWRRARESGQLAALGQRLRDLGLTPPAIERVFGARSFVQAPWHAQVMQLQARAGQLSEALVVPPAALMAHLWVAGAHLERARVEKRLGDATEFLLELGLLHISDERISSTAAIVPVAESLAVCDRADITCGREISQYPDDSALHLVGALPARPLPGDTGWLDVGTGSVIAPLMRPDLAGRIAGTDINPRAIAMAELGLALSRVAHVRVQVADLLAGGQLADHGGKPWRLITFNAPIPSGSSPGDSDDSTPWYRFGAPDILERFWREVPDLIAEDGEVLVHSVVPDGEFPPWLTHLAGETSVVQYTPPGMEPAFGVSAWRPDRTGTGAGSRRHLIQLLSRDAPHVTRRSLGLSEP